MQKHRQLVMDDAYDDFDAPGGAEAYAERSYGHNRGDSIEWARKRCGDDPEVRAFIFELRREFRDVLASVPGQSLGLALLADDQDPNHFLALLGPYADGKYGASLARAATSICGRLKAELNLDLHPSLFQAQRPNNTRPPRRTIRLP